MSKNPKLYYAPIRLKLLWFLISFPIFLILLYLFFLNLHSFSFFRYFFSLFWMGLTGVVSFQFFRMMVSPVIQIYDTEVIVHIYRRQCIPMSQVRVLDVQEKQIRLEWNGGQLDTRIWLSPDWLQFE